jgi:hypothetical protein
MRAIIAALMLTGCTPQVEVASARAEPPRLKQCEDGKRADWMPTYEICEWLEIGEVGDEALAGGAWP